MKKLFTLFQFVFILSTITTPLMAQNRTANDAKNLNPLTGTNFKLPAGFKISIISDSLAGARHLAVTKQGGIYVKLLRLKNGKGIFYLKDTNANGLVDETVGFGDYPGTGIIIKDNYLYASSNTAVYKYKLNEKGEVINPEEPEKIVDGLISRSRDNSKSFTIDNDHNLYVNVGSYSNSCLIDENSKQAPFPCPLLDSVGGIWKFKTDKLNQGYQDGIRYATGFKNTVGIDWNTKTNSLFIMHHGRDLLHDLYPQYYSIEQSNSEPAETMYELHQGSNGGWPYVYYDSRLHKKILAPEYGGDGIKEAGEDAQDPVAYFPAHLAPDGLLFYTGAMFPEKYKNGAFIAFHGKSPELQRGYFVAFVPFKNNKPSGPWEIFADFSSVVSSNQPKPCGLAQGPDGSLYVTDDAKGNIYKIAYKK